MDIIFKPSSEGRWQVICRQIRQNTEDYNEELDNLYAEERTLYYRLEAAKAE